MAEIELKKEPTPEKDNEKKKYIIVAIFAFLVLLLFILAAYFFPTILANRDTKEKRTYSFLPSVIEPTHSLDDNKAYTYQFDEDVSVKIATDNSNATIGLKDQYLYHAYGVSRNDISISFIASEAYASKIVDISYSVYLGENEESKTLLNRDAYILENNNLTLLYSVNTEIYIQSLVIEVTVK